MMRFHVKLEIRLTKRIFWLTITSILTDKYDYSSNRRSISLSMVCSDEEE